jgi:hypothetical protein
VETEDCQIRPGTRLVFHQLPTSLLGQLFEFLDRNKQVVGQLVATSLQRARRRI